MRKILLAAGCSLLLQSYAFGQGVGINDDNSSPAPSAMLDVKSTNKGMLVPRMTTAQRTAIAAPATGLLVFDNTTNGFWYYNGTAWIQLVAGVDNDNQTLGLAGTTLNITGGNSVNLAGIDTDTDNQTMTLAGTTLSIVRGNSVNLAGIDTDDQTLNLSGNTLSIAGGNSVSLAGFTNTDNQTMSLSGTNLNIVRGNTVDLSSLVNDADAVIGNEYNTGFALSGTNLTITDGGGGRTVNLVGLRDNLGDHNATTRLNLANNNIVNVNNLSTRGVDSYDKLRVWSNGSYTIGMNSAMTYGYLNDYAMTFTMNQDDDRGWIWRDINDTKADGAMSLTTNGRLTVKNRTQLQSLAGTGNRMVIANATGELFTQAIPANGDITGVNAGNGMTGGGTAGTVTLNAIGTNGLRTTANDIRWGGNLIENTVISQGGFNLDINLNGTGVFDIQDAGRDVFAVIANGSSRFGDDVQWRDGSTVGTVIADLFDDGNDGRFRIMENGGVAVDLDANTQFVFNEQGLDRNFRVESDNNVNMMFLDAGNDRIGMGTNVPRSILDIRQAAGEPEINMTGATNTDPTLVLTEGGDNPFAGGAIRYDGDLDGLVFLSDLAFPLVDERMFISRNDGDIGMGTTAPNARLSVNGVANKTGGGNWAVFSDRRLKKDITEYKEGLSLINKVRTVNFVYNDKMEEIWGASPDTKGKVYQGVIAQELQEIAPDMVREVVVNEDQKDGDEAQLPKETYLEVDPNKFTYALINAVQEQQAIIDQLKKEQAETKKELAEIKALLLEMNKNK